MEKHFIKYVDGKGKVMYKENDFDFEHNKLVGMNIIIKEQQVNMKTCFICGKTRKEHTKKELDYCSGLRSKDLFQ